MFIKAQFLGLIFGSVSLLSVSQAAERPDTEKQKAAWEQWSESRKNNLKEGLCEATKVSGRGLPGTGTIWLANNAGKFELVRTPPTEGTDSLKIDVNTETHTLLLGEKIEFKLSYDEEVLKEYNLPDFYKMDLPLAINFAGETERLYFTGFIRGDKSSCWFLHDKKRENVDLYRAYEIYSYDEKFIIKATVRRDSKDPEKIGLVFPLGGKEQNISVKDYDASYIHIFFSDATNGKGTYSGGRMFDIELTKSSKKLVDGEELWMDFNFIYNPPCARSTAYTCGLPDVHFSEAIPAGEKFFH